MHSEGTGTAYTKDKGAVTLYLDVTTDAKGALLASRFVAAVVIEEVKRYESRVQVKIVLVVEAVPHNRDVVDDLRLIREQICREILQP